jgi:hypothetical protein
MGANPAAQVRFVNYLGSVTAPGVFPREFALLEMITELSNGHCAGIRCSGMGDDFRDQPYHGAPRGLLIRVSVDRADNLFVANALSILSSLRPTKLPHLRAMLPSFSLQTPLLHIVLLRRNCIAEELSVMTKFDRLLAASELLCGGNARSWTKVVSWRKLPGGRRAARNS